MLFDLAQEAERLDDGFGHLGVLCGILLEDAEEDGESARADLLRAGRGRVSGWFSGVPVS